MQNDWLSARSAAGITKTADGRVSEQQKTTDLSMWMMTLRPA